MNRTDSVSRLGRMPSLCFVSMDISHLLLDSEKTDVGGAEVQLVQFARLLQARRWSVSFVAEDSGHGQEVSSPEGIRILASYRPSVGGSAIGWGTHKWPRLWRALCRADADIYVTRGGGWLTGAVALFARLRGRKSVFWIASQQDVADYGAQTQLPRHVRACYRYGIRHCDAIIAQTQEQRTLMMQALGCNPTVIPNLWIPDNGEVREVEAGDVGVLWVGNIRPRKRPEMALEVAERLPELRLTMIGGPVPGSEELYQRVVRRADELGNVDCLGHVPHDEIHAYYARATALLHTSETEGFPNVFLEAWGHGVPVVSTLDPDHVIRQHCLGAVCKTRAELALRLRELCNDGRRRDAMGQAAIGYVRRHHSPRAIVATAEQVLLGVAANRLGTTGVSPR